MPPPLLDVRIEELRADRNRTWGAREAGLSLLLVPLVLVLSGGLLVAVGLPVLAAATGSTAAVAAAAVLVARRAAAQSGGWESAFGLDLPLWSDSWRIVRWTLALLLLESVFAGLLTQVLPALSDARASNTGLLAEQSLLGLLVFAVLAVTVAPVLEELVFRGLVLRGLMLRLGFWPAAGLSSAVFGLLHATALDASGLLVVATITLLGLGLCLLARQTGRLGPSIGVHALHNAVAVLVVAVTG